MNDEPTALMLRMCAAALVATAIAGWASRRIVRFASTRAPDIGLGRLGVLFVSYVGVFMPSYLVAAFGALASMPADGDGENLGFGMLALIVGTTLFFVTIALHLPWLLWREWRRDVRR